MSGIILPGSGDLNINSNPTQAQMLASNPEMQRIMSQATEIDFLKQELAGMQRCLATLAWKYAGGKAIISDEEMMSIPTQIHAIREDSKSRMLLWVSTEILNPDSIVAEAGQMTTDTEESSDEGS